MGCNCGKTGTPNIQAGKPAPAGKYALTLPDGTRNFYNSEPEARAANRAAGGKGLVRRVQ